jgi:hypothetical protein
MVCVSVSLLLKRNVGVIFGDGQLTETCKGSKYLQVESHWTVLTIIL